MKKSTLIERTNVLNDIFDYFQQIEQWSRYNLYENCSKYNYKAESLIELLEDNDCGQIGGYDPELLSRIGINKNYNLNLFERFILVCIKYNNLDLFMYNISDLLDIYKLFNSKNEKIKKLINKI